MSYIFHFMYFSLILFSFFFTERFINGSLQGFPWGGKFNFFYYYFSLVGIIPVFMYGKWAT